MNLRKIVPLLVSSFFIVLFVYASVSKMMDFENFQVQLAQSPLLSAFAGTVSYAVIAAEFLITGLLLFKVTRRIGLYSSFGLMIAFTVYIWLILKYSDFVPCSCGGILEKMTWDQHLIFNAGSVLLALTAIIFDERKGVPEGRRSAVRLLSTALFSAGSVVILFISSETVIKKRNNFTRRFIQQPFEKEKVLDLGANSYYFAGADQGHIYLGNHTAPQILTVVNKDLLLKKESRISLEPDSLSFHSVRIAVHVPYFYVHDGSIPVIFKGHLSDLKAHLFSKDDAYFTQLAVIDSNRIAFKSQNGETQKRTLGLLDIRSNPKVFLNSDMMDNNAVGMFATDGTLLHDDNYKQLIYTFFYTNAIITMDEHLNFKNQFRTIDTVGRARVMEVTLKDGIHKMSAPPLIVNKKTVVAGGNLFNESNLIGRYEDRKVWDQASVVDVYATNKPLYKGSFYVFTRDRGKTKMSHFMIDKNSLYALVGNSLIKLPFSARLMAKLKNGETENH